jgi:hypothetical protein
MGTMTSAVFVDFGSAPRVANVTISGHDSMNSPYSFSSHVGSGEQLRTVPVGAADTVSITFSEDVNINPSDFRIVGTRTFNVPTIANFSYDTASMTATWRLENLKANDQYLISLSDLVTDVEGNRLDGEWINPASLSTTNSSISHFPSGDGHAGGDFNFVFTLLAGDANRDNVVNYSDYYIWSSHYGQSGGFQIGDFNGNGTVGTEDIVLFYGNYGRSLQGVFLTGDVTGDGVVNHDDLDVVLSNFGSDDPLWEIGDVNGDRSIDYADVDCIFAQYGMGLALAY